MIQPAFRLDEQRVLVTGGLGILGQRMVRGFREAGASVAVVDMLPDTAKRTKEVFGDAEGPTVRGYTYTIGLDSNPRALIDTVVADLGPLNHILNNAASKGSDVLKFMAGPDDFTPETWAEVMDVNLNGTFFLAQAAAAHMRTHDAPKSMTFTSSIYGSIAPNPSLYEGSHYMGTQINTPPIYSASKGGIVALSRYLAGYWGKDGIRVNTLTPGGVRSGQNDEFVQRYESRTPLGRMGAVEDLVGPAVFLATPAAAYITGTNLFVDGGFSCW